MPARPNANVFDKVRKAASALPDVAEGISWGVPALKVRGTMFACIATNKQAEPDSLVARLSFVDRDWLIAQDPDVFYLKPHYLNYPCVLARLRRIKAKDLRELLVNSREFVASLKTRRKRGTAR
ncbi:MAG TPA: MmcQ/YjbR family DNA-binding protein [Gemmatimonadaceae bacterium]|jgi:hypothetical protein